MCIRDRCEWQREISKFKVLTTTWTHDSNSFILYICINGASTSPFAVCSVNNKGGEKKIGNHKIVTISQMFISKWLFCYRGRCLSSRFPMRGFFMKTSKKCRRKIVCQATFAGNIIQCNSAIQPTCVTFTCVLHILHMFSFLFCCSVWWLPLSIAYSRSAALKPIFPWFWMWTERRASILWCQKE